MIKPDDPRELALDLIDRSICTIQVGACIADNWGVYSWGWNSMGSDGLGQCAETHAIKRANKARFNSTSTIYVASRRRRNGKVVPAKPCADCAYIIGKWGLKVKWRDNDGEWKDM